ncbi:hypothetical protein PAMP_007265 [Pampus punctatissimus]
MAALWLHSASLLILLVMSCPGSKAFSSPFLCGRDLVDVLYLFCAERGFVYPKRNVDSVLRETTNCKTLNRTEQHHQGTLYLKTWNFSVPMMQAGGAAPADTNFASKNQMEMMVKRGIGDQCCHRPCSILDLEKYCI